MREKERQWEAELASLMGQSSMAESKSDNEKGGGDSSTKTEVSASNMVQESKA